MKDLKELQKREDELWKLIEESSADAFAGIKGYITELVDVNIEIEKDCNQ